ncbi:unnamed protein product [Cylicocyclus nassatus]|uniref:DRBM domain-containing protein n=1 Tax=Cylicocyclus nassatus TaxID=53992 RepID=A0AA36GV88_CYLNA|nr:unnamed protein product [Cylicocyclus nassatus]
MPTLEDFFTPIDELRYSEPSYFTSSMSSQSTSTGAFAQKTPVMALDEGSRRVYGVAPEYQLISEVPTFKISCQLAGKFVTCDAKTKKTAKHLAARAMLHEVINKGRHAEFGIPGETMQEAHQAVDALVFGDARNEGIEDEMLSPETLNENYSGKLLQLCQRKSIEPPQYSVSEEGPPNDRTYTTICRVVNQEAKGVAKQKKVSKNIASQRMLNLLMEGIGKMNEDLDLEKAGTPSKENHEENADTEVPGADMTTPTAPLDWEKPSSNAVETLKEILSDPKKFDAPTQEYRIIENKSAFGLTQCLLKIVFAKPGEQQRTPFVFPGEHTTEEGAKQQAAHRAVLFLTS